jgi:hypothetical protein
MIWRGDDCFQIVITGLDPVIHLFRVMDTRVKPGMTSEYDALTWPHRTSTFRNCQGSDVSMSSGNSPGRSESGVQSV